jgi:hypothetical protein
MDSLSFSVSAESPLSSGFEDWHIVNKIKTKKKNLKRIITNYLFTKPQDFMIAGITTFILTTAELI